MAELPVTRAGGRATADPPSSRAAGTAGVLPALFALVSGVSKGAPSGSAVPHGEVPASSEILKERNRDGVLAGAAFSSSFSSADSANGSVRVVLTVLTE